MYIYSKQMFIQFPLYHRYNKHQREWDEPRCGHHECLLSWNKLSDRCKNFFFVKTHFSDKRFEVLFIFILNRKYWENFYQILNDRKNRLKNQKFSNKFCKIVCANSVHFQAKIFLWHVNSTHLIPVFNTDTKINIIFFR